MKFYTKYVIEPGDLKKGDKVKNNLNQIGIIKEIKDVMWIHSIVIKITEKDSFSEIGELVESKPENVFKVNKLKLFTDKINKGDSFYNFALNKFFKCFDIDNKRIYYLDENNNLESFKLSNKILHDVCDINNNVWVQEDMKFKQEDVNIVTDENGNISCQIRCITCGVFH